MFEQKVKFRFGVVLLFSLMMIGACHSEAKDDNPREKPVENLELLKIIDKLSSFKNFRMKISELDSLVKGNCEKQKEAKDEFGQMNKYVCSPQSGMESVQIDWRNGGGEAYVMTLSVDFKYSEYDRVKSLVAKRLGKEPVRKKDMNLWRYSSDKKLNALGNPVIYVARDQGDHTASFELGLEQGP